jgi:hypothetical protein
VRISQDSVLDRVTTLADLHDGGRALSPNEIDRFVQSDPRIWFGCQVSAGSRLQSSGPLELWRLHAPLG